MSLAPEPTNYSWWLRAEYKPFSKAVRGIPIKLLSKQWCYANEFVESLFPAEYLEEIDSTLSFSVTSRFNHRKKLTALVGAYETCANEKGLFLLIFEQRNKYKIVRFMEQFPFQNRLAALRLTEQNTLELWWCSECNFYQELYLDTRQNKFIWRFEEDPA